MFVVVNQHIQYAKTVLLMLERAGYLPKGFVQPTTPADGTMPEIPGTVKLWAAAFSTLDASESNWKDAVAAIITRPKPTGGVTAGDVVAECRRIRRRNMERVPWEHLTPPADLADELFPDYKKAIYMMAARGETDYHAKAKQYVETISRKELSA